MSLLDDALHFAIEKHSGQIRKMAKSPYILHPMEAVTVAGTMTDDEATLAATALHDTIEDAGVTFEEIRDRFGMRVALLVMTETEEKRADRPPMETWQLRKEETLMMLENTDDRQVKILWLGDKLANMRSFYREYLKRGDAMWNGFNQKDPAIQAWYYRTIARALKELEEYPAYQEYVRLMNTVFEHYPENSNKEVKQ